MDVNYQYLGDLKICAGVYIGNYSTIHVINYDEHVRNSVLEIGKNTYIG